MAGLGNFYDKQNHYNNIKTKHGLGDVYGFLAKNIGKSKVDIKDILNNEILTNIVKEVEMEKIRSEDPPIEDATDHLLIAAQGPKVISYLSPELTTVGRVSNAISTNNQSRLHGLPTKSDIALSFSDKSVRDKQLWKATGNGLKANAWYDQYDGEIQTK